MARIGIMGGTFDPIHNGHLMLGRQAYQEYSLDQIWFMPSGQPPHKTDHHVTGSNYRCDMVKLAIAVDTHFVFSDFEVYRKGNTYTADTVMKLKEFYPKHDFFFIVGADSLYQIETWYRPEIILGTVPLLVANRECEGKQRSLMEQIVYIKEKYQGEIYLLHSPEVNIASADLRELAVNGQSLTEYVPEAVVSYIRHHHLYDTREKIIDIRKQLKDKLSPSRYEHSLSVSFICSALAMCYGYDIERAELAGILHDCAKCYNEEKLVKLCRKHDISLTEDELLAPAVIHAKYGVWMAKHKYGVTDQEILDAIRWHATGRPEMHMLDMILYIADYIEPRRYKADNLPQMRKLAFIDLEMTMRELLSSSLAYLKESGSHIDVMTAKAYEYYFKKNNGKGDTDAIK